jgi:glycosyltransferase involved in cell wall biosynthesis
MENVHSVCVVPKVINFHFIWQQFLWRITKKPKLYRHCNMYKGITSHSKIFKEIKDNAELIIVNRVTYLPYFKDHGCVYLETHDVMAKTIDFKSNKALDYELELAKKYAKIIGCYTDSDYDDYRSVCGDMVVNSQPGILPSPPKYFRHKGAVKNLLYVGDNHPQNAYAIIKCIENLPQKYNLLVVGRVINSINPAEIPANVKLIGYVKDLSPYINKCDVIIIPDFVGTGISVKAIELLSMGKPVYVSSNALRGLDIALPDCAVTDGSYDVFFNKLLKKDNEIIDSDWNKVSSHIVDNYGKNKTKLWAQKVVDYAVD